MYRNKSKTAIEKLLNTEIKEILFKTYIMLDDKKSYDKVNKRSWKYLSKLNSSISKEGYILREKSLILIDKLQARYESEEENEYRSIFSGNQCFSR